MNFKFVVAIVRPEDMKPLREKLRIVGVEGITLTKVKGFGEYRNYFAEDLLSEHVKVEIFAEDSKVQVLLGALLELGENDIPGAGIAAVIPVDKFLHLRTGTDRLPARST